jgi:hypothetical protein
MHSSRLNRSLVPHNLTGSLISRLDFTDGSGHGGSFLHDSNSMISALGNRSSCSRTRLGPEAEEVPGNCFQGAGDKQPILNRVPAAQRLC